MSKNDVTVTEKFACDKEVNCAWCGATYEFVHEASVSGTGKDHRIARQKMKEQVQKELEGDTGSERCPTCGAMQLAMDANTSAAGHGCAMWFAIILFGIIALLAFLQSQGVITFVTLPTLSIVMLVILLPAVLYNLWIVWSNPNASLDAGLRDAEQKVTDGKVKILKAGNSMAVSESIPRQVTPMQYIGVVLCLLGISAFPAAEILRMTKGWKTNARTFPPVVGPGDEVTLFWPKSLSCLKGKWNAQATVEMTDAAGTMPAAPLAATSSNETWGDYIGGKGATNRSTAIWMKVTLPEDANLAGKEIRLPSKITVNYPHSNGMFGFDNNQESFENNFTLQLSGPRAGVSYYRNWWIGLSTGGFLVIVSAFILRRIQLRILKDNPKPVSRNFRRAETEKTSNDQDESNEESDDDDAVEVG